MKDKQASGAGRTMSIGAAVKTLRKDYPDLSISKVRYLEDEGLLKLGRTKGGYRVFADEDLKRLSEILRLQKEHFLPLNEIKKRMRGWKPGKSVRVAPADPSRPAKEAQGKDEPILLADALKKTGANAEMVKTLESFGMAELIKEGDTLALSPEDYQVLKITAELSRFAIEPRHLRIFDNQAQKESLLFQQIMSAQLKNKRSKTRRQSFDDLKELMRQTEELKRIMLEKALRKADIWQ